MTNKNNYSRAKNLLEDMYHNRIEDQNIIKLIKTYEEDNQLLSIIDAFLEDGRAPSFVQDIVVQILRKDADKFDYDSGFVFIKD